MTSYLERFPPVLLDSIVVGWLVAMVTLPWHSGRPPECTEMVGKGGVSPLVLFAGVTGHRQEAAHRELRLRLCGMMTEGRHQVMARARGQNACIRKSCSLKGTLSANKHLCAPVPLHPPHPLAAKPHLRTVFQWEATLQLHFLQWCLLCTRWQLLLPYPMLSLSLQVLSYTQRSRRTVSEVYRKRKHCLFGSACDFSNILGRLPQASHGICLGIGSFLQTDGSRQESDMSLQYVDCVVL